jgi:hypothetical protein
LGWLGLTVFFCGLAWRTRLRTVDHPGFDHQPHRMILRQPLPHVRRQQEHLIPVNRPTTLATSQFYRKPCRQTGETDSATTPTARVNPMQYRGFRVA